MKFFLHTLAISLIIGCISTHSVALQGIESRPVHFAKGATASEIKGVIKGYQTIDYKLSAKAGQTMSVALKTNNNGNFFNVLPVGSNDVAVFVGSSEGNTWTGTLTKDGVQTIRVYLMRNTARRNESAKFTLTIGINGSPATSSLGVAPAGDAKVKGTPYHATGQLACSMGADKAMQCDFGVIRGKPGNAEVHITPPGGFKRVLTFVGDAVTTNPGKKIKAVKQGYDWFIEVNDYEHYTIPFAVVQGG